MGSTSVRPTRSPRCSKSAGISADKTPEDGQANAYKIVVARAEAGRAFALLEAHDLPKRSWRGLSDTFSGGTLLPSPTEDRARYGAALAAELERSLEEIPGVVSARVHLALPPEESLVGEAAHARPTASVLLKTPPHAAARARPTCGASSPARSTACNRPTSASSWRPGSSIRARPRSIASVRCASRTSRGC